MNYRSFCDLNKKILLSIFLLLSESSIYLNAQNDASKKHALQALMITKVLEKYHYRPQQLNDALSEKLNTEFLKSLDPSGIYFTKKEITELKKWDNQLDDEIKNESTKYLSMVSDLYYKKLIWTDSLITSITSQPLDFNKKDTIFFLGKKAGVTYVDENRLIKRWTKLIKYEVLDMLYTPTDKSKDPFSQDIQELFKNEPEVRAKIAIRNKRSIKRILEHEDGYSNYISSQFINKLISLYDPHSSFFSASEKQDFESSISSSELSFGFYFDENEKGEIAITNISPGGSAWKSNQLHKGDVILKIKPKHGNTIDLTLSSHDEALDLFASFSDNEAEFTIRKTGGEIKNVVLVKTKIKSDENVVKSYILKGEKKIGWDVLMMWQKKLLSCRKKTLTDLFWTYVLMVVVLFEKQWD